MKEPPSRTVVVLHVPAPGALSLEEPVPPLLEDLALAVRLTANRIVTEDETDRKDLAAGEARVVPAAGRQVEVVRFLPAADLQCDRTARGSE